MPPSRPCRGGRGWGRALPGKSLPSQAQSACLSGGGARTEPFMLLRFGRTRGGGCRHPESEATPKAQRRVRMCRWFPRRIDSRRPGGSLRAGGRAGARRWRVSTRAWRKRFRTSLRSRGSDAGSARRILVCSSKPFSLTDETRGSSVRARP